MSDSFGNRNIIKICFGLSHKVNKTHTKKATLIDKIFSLEKVILICRTEKFERVLLAQLNFCHIKKSENFYVGNSYLTQSLKLIFEFLRTDGGIALNFSVT